MQKTIRDKFIRWGLLLYLIILITVSVIPLGSVSKQIMDVHVIKLRGDYFLHMLVYLPMVLLLFLSCKRWNWWLLGVALVIAAGLEFVQMWLPYRSFNINDLIANVAGVVLGTAIFPLVVRIRRSGR